MNSSSSCRDGFSSTCRFHSLILFTTLILGILSTLAAAQAPVPVIAMAYATIAEKTFYVQGGVPNGGRGASNQLFSLDLTQPQWAATSPPWKALNTQKVPADYHHSLVVSLDQQSLIFWGSNKTGTSVYNIASGAVTKRSLPIPGLTEWGPMRAVADPGSGLVYIPAGFNDGSLVEYNPTTGNIRLFPMQAGLDSIAGYSAVWSTHRKSLLLYGGATTPGGDVWNTQLYEFFPGSLAWRSLNTIGTSPGTVSGHCMVPVYDGTKIVVFGGKNEANQFSGIYILDTQSLTWTKGKDIAPSQNRALMACTAAGDNFISWGGFADNETEPLGTPVIYNIKSDQWTDQFVLATPSNPATSTAAIGGAIAGAVAGTIIVAAIGFIGFRRHKSSKTNRSGSKTHPSFDPKTNYEPGNKQFGAIILRDVPSSREQAAVNKQSCSPEQVRQPPYAHLPTKANKEYEGDFAVSPPKYNSSKDEVLSPAPNTVARSLQDDVEQPQRYSPDTSFNAYIQQSRSINNPYSQPPPPASHSPQYSHYTQRSHSPQGSYLSRSTHSPQAPYSPQNSRSSQASNSLQSSRSPQTLQREGTLPTAHGDQEQMDEQIAYFKEQQDLQYELQRHNLERFRAEQRQQLENLRTSDGGKGDAEILPIRFQPHKEVGEMGFILTRLQCFLDVVFGQRSSFPILYNIEHNSGNTAKSGHKKGVRSDFFVEVPCRAFSSLFNSEIVGILGEVKPSEKDRRECIKIQDFWELIRMTKDEINSQISKGVVKPMVICIQVFRFQLNMFVMTMDPDEGLYILHTAAEGFLPRSVSDVSGTGYIISIFQHAKSLLQVFQDQLNKTEPYSTDMTTGLPQLQKFVQSDVISE
ncbi:hypothetical protein BGX27_007860 [Mortierella sp. AM989]|nr:hypothetical protein BGX27_007860 [Mortierella sp. AM989]